MKVVILAGGFGTRISEESHLRPKPMIEIGGMPILWHIMKYYSSFGYNEFIICAGYKQSVIKEWFADYYINHSDVTFDFTTKEKIIVHRTNSEPWRVTVVDTGLNTMTGGRLKRIRRFLGNEPFMMTYGDGVSDIDLDKLVAFHETHGKLATMTAVHPDSRFGVMADEIEGDLGLVDGLHVHALCEGYADDFAGMVERLVSLLGGSVFRELLPRLKWINLGGGEVICDSAFATPRAVAAVAAIKALGRFEVMIEPSEYMVRYSGSLVAHVLDVIRRKEKDIAVLDVSASCHATDLLLFDMRADIVSPAQSDGGRRTVLGCVSCLAGDVIGEYRFANPLEVGDTVIIGGLGCYSFAQQSWFNGIRRPDVVLVSKAGGERVILSWDWSDYLREFQ